MRSMFTTPLLALVLEPVITSLAFVGDGVVTLQGFSEAEANAITNSFGAAGGGTANFGTALAIPTFS